MYEIRKQEYDLYLQSDHWQQLRWKVMCQQREQCQVCGGRNITLHHITYPEDFYSQRHLPTMIVILCFECHKVAHLLLDWGFSEFGDTKERVLRAIKSYKSLVLTDGRRQKFFAQQKPNYQPRRHNHRKQAYQNKIMENDEERNRSGNFVKTKDGNIVYKPRI